MVSLTPLLDRAPTPGRLRELREEDLRSVAAELRDETIRAAAVSGGHFGGGLGVVELTVALHYVFDTPRDRLIWDVGHQTYPHKILTGRRDRIRSIRQRGGLYGFTRRSESVYDPFGAAHSSTSISAALGMAAAHRRTGSDARVVCVIGDGAITGGMAYEALNHAGAAGLPLTVVVNDNGMSIAPATGALPAHLAHLRAGSANNFFTALGCHYIGPVDGHDMKALLDALRAARNGGHPGPVVVHAVTEKAKGHPFAGPDKESYHAIAPFDLAAPDARRSKGANAPTYTQIFADRLIAEAERDPRIVAITAAMPSGTGLDRFGQRFPDRMFDVGIAEQHAVTFAAGMACEGLRPFCAIYSTFLQRGFDQIVHDVALQGLPVRFAIDRAGLVGQDGATHAGSFDVACLSELPGMVVAAPSDGEELARMVSFAADYDAGPMAFRYPRGEAHLPGGDSEVPPLRLGRGRIVREGGDVAIFCLGSRLADCLAAAETLNLRGIAVTVADARFCKPLDRELAGLLARNHELLVTVEEGAIGGFASHVLHHLAESDLLGRTRFRSLILPDTFIAHGTPVEQLRDAGLDADSIAEAILAAWSSRPARRASGIATRAVAAPRVV